jgi:tetratricopeptide (TPR) repeat protein
MLAQFCNNSAWGLATAPAPSSPRGEGARRADEGGVARDLERALRLARRAVELSSGRSIYLNTLGVAQYRAGHLTEAIPTLEKSLATGKGETDAFDLFFLAMARFRLGQIERAHADFARAIQWRRGHPNLPEPSWNEELDTFEAEVRALLDHPPPELPADVLAPE